MLEEPGLLELLPRLLPRDPIRAPGSKRHPEDPDMCLQPGPLPWNLDSHIRLPCSNHRPLKLSMFQKETSTTTSEEMELYASACSGQKHCHPWLILVLAYVQSIRNPAKETLKVDMDSTTPQQLQRSCPAPGHHLLPKAPYPCSPSELPEGSGSVCFLCLSLPVIPVSLSPVTLPSSQLYSQHLAQCVHILGTQ